VALALLVSFVVFAPCDAASFNCARARSPDEMAICRDRALNDQDVRVAVLYEVSSIGRAPGSRTAGGADRIGRA
jgi:uncharacterized protein